MHDSDPVVSIWADVGGTFTDCFVVRDWRRTATKVLSSGLVYASVISNQSPSTLRLKSFPASDVENFWVGAKVSSIDDDGNAKWIGRVTGNGSHHLTLDADVSGDETSLQIDAGLQSPVLAARILLGVPVSDPLPRLDVRLGTTRGTNALLTRTGAATALVITRGFGDALAIGEQDRPDLFSLSIRKPSPLYQAVVEVEQRISASGEVLTPLDETRLRGDLVRLRNEGITSLAIALMHSHVNDEHERRIETIAREVGFDHISRSAEVAPLIKLVSRAETTALDAYLNPILAGYTAQVWQQFGGADRCRFRLMTSGGNLVPPDAFRGRDSILSGPAGGVVALAAVARASGTASAIGLDMGGTSTDVSRVEGKIGRRTESRVAGVRVMTPMMDIETVAAGGGSICDFIDGRLVVGPASAGADPGPACYGRGGPLTVTDVNLLLGRIPESRFPFALSRDASVERVETILGRIDSGAITGYEQLAEGFLDLAVTHMAEAVRTVSTAQGSDVRRMTLVGFGGASGQHLCRVASALGMKRILDHPDAGMLSALGMGLADVGRVVTLGVYRLLSQIEWTEIESLTDKLIAEAHALLADENPEDVPIDDTIDCDVRYQGTEAAIAIDLFPFKTIADRFHAVHQTTFGYQQPGRNVELVCIRCESKIHGGGQVVAPENEGNANSTQAVLMWHGGDWIEAALVDRAGLKIGDKIVAPTMVVSDHGTLIIEPGWMGTVTDGGVIELSPSYESTEVTNVNSADDPVLVEIVARRLQGIADAMGEVLRRTSISVNVKERRDYSCAVFRGDGSLVANAPHVPVHLGAMGHTVRHLMQAYPQMSPGDAFVTNNPFAGGSHLPDVTLVTPVFCDGSVRDGKPDFFVASRAHHAEIGGRTPGSMPPDATSLAEEGVLIADFALRRNGVSKFDELRDLLLSGPYPSRSVDENLADIAAALAAGTYGAARLRELASNYSPAIVTELMGRVLDLAGDAMSAWIKTLPADEQAFADTLDDGTPIGVRIHRVGSRLSIAMQSGPVHPHGFNATPAIVTAAVLYVLRCVSQTNLPLCEGVLRDVDLIIPPGLLDPPFDENPAQCAAVVAGNVETSQRIVDVLLGAIGGIAASQGTMNNVIFGDETFGYYETIGGGSGATSAADGADAVHTHMTNTRMTDPEVVESRLPVRLHRFAIRRGSGGNGKHRGGDGIIREFEFLKPLTLSLLTGRRVTRPYGADGGEAGSPGRNVLISRDQTIELPPTATVAIEAGDRLIIETPGGGGWGSDAIL